MIVILGSGAFGTALAITLARSHAVTLWARDPQHAAEMQGTRENARRLPGVSLPENIRVCAEIETVETADAVLLAVPMQKLRALLEEHGARLAGPPLVACCKGIELTTGLGPTQIIAQVLPQSPAAILTGPSFAADIAKRLPTALTLACTDDEIGRSLQSLLSTGTLRLYRTTDVIGAELGGGAQECYGDRQRCGDGRGPWGKCARGPDDPWFRRDVPDGHSTWSATRDTFRPVRVWRSRIDLHLGSVAEHPFRAEFGSKRSVRSNHHSRRCGHGKGGVPTRGRAWDRYARFPRHYRTDRWRIAGGSGYGYVVVTTIEGRMMLIALIARDKPGALQTRLDNREAHIAYLKETGVVSQAGPLLDEDGNMAGSLVILDVEDMAQAQDWASNDPYAKAGLFGSVDLIEWKKVI